MRYMIIFAVVLAIALLWPRLAPTDPMNWHVMPRADGVGDVSRMGGFTAARQITTTSEGILQAIDRIALATPRTARVAGSVEEGMITYQTRSRIFGFPDYTTVAVTDDPLLIIDARLRFGKGDMGVNKARVTDWLSQLGPLIVAP